MMVGWHPGCGAAVRWTSWQEYFDDTDLLRDELMADPEVLRMYGVGTEPFADRLRRELAERPGTVYEKHGGWEGHVTLKAKDGHDFSSNERHSHVRFPDDQHEHRRRGGDEDEDATDPAPVPSKGKVPAMVGSR